jgi:FAD/FMN-containing dehydrogenase
VTARTLSLHGRVVGPDTDGYDAARRLWNAAIDRRPALIACCEDVDDVVAALRFAREEGLEVSVRSGGHGVAGQSVCDGGLVIDVAGLKRVEISGRVARAGAGLLNAEFDAATQAHGLATTAGIVSHTGLAGLTLGGGIGWLMRARAATCDNLLGAQLVTAAGETLEVDGEHELLWALRGAGANFGVVSRLDLRLHPLGPVLAGVLMFPAERAEPVLSAYADHVASAPRELGTVVNLRRAPPLPWVPEQLRGVPVVMLVVCWCGAPDRGERVIEPLRALRPLVDTIAAEPYTQHQRLFDPAVPHGLQYRWRSHYVADLDDAVLRVLCANAWTSASPRSYTIVFQLGGALADVDPASAVFAGRTGFAVNINAAWTSAGGPDDDTAWVQRSSDALRHRSAGVYVNFLDEEGPERVASAYAASYPRLQELKRRYDPDNVFRHNHNIEPART